MTARADIEHVRRRNRSLILRELRRRGAAARTVLSEATGLSSATVSTITAEMLAEGVLQPAESAPARAQGRGRPQTPLALAPGYACVLAIGVWVDRVRYALHDHRGAVIAEAEAPPPDRDGAGAALAERLCAEATAFLKDRPEAARLASVRVAVQGVADGAGRGVRWSPIFASGSEGLACALERALGRPALILNDATAMAEALHWRDPETYGSDFALVLIGYGVGMGLFLGGERFGGKAVSGAEFGHMNHLPGGALCRCGRLGCVEAYAADYGIWRAAGGGSRGLAPPPPGRMAELAARARSGDARARAAYAEAGRAIGFGLGRAFALIGAVRVAFAGNGAAALDLMEEGIRSGLRDSLVRELSCEPEWEAFEDAESLALEGAALTALVELDASGPAALDRRSATDGA